MSHRTFTWFRFIRQDGWAPMHPLPVKTPIEAWDFWEDAGNNVEILERIEICDSPL